MEYREKLQVLAALVEKESIEDLHKWNLACDANIEYARTKIIEGNKYDKIDIGNSGKLMIEARTGNIFGIKAYGQIHKKKYYGNLDTINEWYWGEYYPRKK